LIDPDRRRRQAVTELSEMKEQNRQDRGASHSVEHEEMITRMQGAGWRLQCDAHRYPLLDLVIPATDAESLLVARGVFYR
jgi:hypothetical protein